jgi:hypothetical protein
VLARLLATMSIRRLSACSWLSRTYEEISIGLPLRKNCFENRHWANLAG